MEMELWMKVEEDRTAIQDKTLRGEMVESKQGEGKDRQPVKDRNRRKKEGKDNEMKRRRSQFLNVCFSYLLFYYFFLLDLLWLSVN